MLTFKLASRNLLRNRWRSGLTLGGIAVATTILVWSAAFTDAFTEQMINGATAVNVGQIQIHNSAYAERPQVDEFFPTDAEMLRKIRALDGVEATPHIFFSSLLGHEKHSVVARITGVDPVHERNVTLISAGLTQGEWLPNAPPSDDLYAPLNAVIGEQLAKQLNLEVGSEVTAIFAGALGTSGNALLNVVGVVRTGNQLIDRQGVYVDISRLQAISRMEGYTHELMIKTEDLMLADEDAVKVQAIVDETMSTLYANSDIPKDFQRPLTVRTWKKIQPELHEMLEMSSKSTWITYALIYAIAALGLLNTQRMSTIERQREFGVLLSVGLSPWRLGAILIFEALFLALAGGIIGAIMGSGLSYYFTETGLNMGAFTDSDSGGFSYMGVAFNERIFFRFHLRHVIRPLQVLVPISMLCGLWPAITAMRLNAIQAVAGRS